MYKIIKTLFSGLMIWGLTVTAQATLINSGASTIDTDSGFEWLDLTSTQGMSVATAIAEASADVTLFTSLFGTTLGDGSLGSFKIDGTTNQSALA